MEDRGSAVLNGLHFDGRCLIVAGLGNGAVLSDG